MRRRRGGLAPGRSNKVTLTVMRRVRFVPNNFWGRQGRVGGVAHHVELILNERPRPCRNGGVLHEAMVLVCLPLAAPIGLSPLHILTLCGSERVLVVSTEPLVGPNGGRSSTDRNTAMQATDGLWTEARGQQKLSNDAGNNQHILNTPMIGCR